MHFLKRSMVLKFYKYHNFDLYGNNDLLIEEIIVDPMKNMFEGYQK